MSGCEECELVKKRLATAKKDFEGLSTWKVWQTMSVGNVKKTILELIEYFETGVYRRR